MDGASNRLWECLATTIRGDIPSTLNFLICVRCVTDRCSNLGRLERRRLVLPLLHRREKGPRSLANAYPTMTCENIEMV